VNNLTNTYNHYSEQKVNRYCYFLTEYCRFTLRDFIDCRNDYFFNNSKGYDGLFCEKDRLVDNSNINAYDIENIAMLKSLKGNDSDRDMIIENQDQLFKEIVIQKEKNKKSRHMSTCDELGIKRKVPKCYIKASFNSDLSVKRTFFILLIKQILQGLIHLHDKNIIHNDIKPSNIFFTSMLIPKIGDFGMCEKPIGKEMYYDYQSLQYKKTDSVLYEDMFVDIKKMGIIFFEMLYPIQTAMERYEVLPDLEERGVLPKDFTVTFPREAEIILSCVNFDRDKTITAKTLEEKISCL